LFDDVAVLILRSNQYIGYKPVNLAITLPTIELEIKAEKLFMSNQLIIRCTHTYVHGLTHIHTFT